MTSIARRIADELSVRESQVDAAVRLLDEGATVPFVARYRKEATGGLDDTQLRTLEERLGYLRELEERRTQVLASIREQGKLTDDLEARILVADTKTRLEDLYLPYRPKRRTRAQIAREAGLEPLALGLLHDPTQTPDDLAAGFVDAEKGVADARSALDGARHILIEMLGEDADLVGRVRTFVAEQGTIVSRAVEDKRETADAAKFSDYFDHREPLRQVASHRALAMFRGRALGILDLSVETGDAADEAAHPCVRMIAGHAGIADRGRPADRWLLDTARWAWKTKIGLHVELDQLSGLREKAEEEAIRVFGRNLHDLLLAPPAGPRPTMGLDPGIRTGVKVAVVDATGKLVETLTVYPHQPRNDWDGSIAALAAICARHRVELIAIGNGTASRETDRLAADMLQRHPDLKATRVIVSEAGASVYSASETAAREFPGLDVSLRGAVSIARRLQDPLAELVKIEPKSIGVGQYQHDVGQSKLARTLDAVVEDCVNAVGVDLNTASVPLLARVSGLSEGVARNIVDFRDANGAFRSRKQLLEVPRLGPKAFEQAAGFLRIRNGDDPLDASAVHPESYPVVERILSHASRRLETLIGDVKFIRSLAPEAFVDDRFGLPTVRDILAELEKPGRDPRPEFRMAAFKEGIEKLEHLQPGMMMEGVVTNVTAFGAFVDVGVHQDGLVHISQLASSFVKDPHSVVKAGDVVKVRVIEVDLKRRRIALTMRLDERPARPPEGRPSDDAGRTAARPPRKPGRSAAKPAPAVTSAGSPFGGALAEAFARARDSKQRRD